MEVEGMVTRERERVGRHATPAILDAGGELAASLSGSMHRCLGDLAVGQVLEVVSREPGSRLQIPTWCRLTGHELLVTHHTGSDTLFWIRKR